MVVRRDDIIASLWLADEFQRPVAEHFIDVHIDRRSRAALNGIHRELIQHLARDDLVGSCHQRFADLLVQPSRCHIGQCRSFLYLGKRLNKVRVNDLSGDLEVVDGTHRLHAVVYLVRYLKFSQKIVFFSHDLHVPFSLPLSAAIQNPYFIQRIKPHRSPCRHMETHGKRNAVFLFLSILYHVYKIHASTFCKNSPL